MQRSLRCLTTFEEGRRGIVKVKAKFRTQLKKGRQILGKGEQIDHQNEVITISMRSKMHMDLRCPVYSTFYNVLTDPEP